MKNNIVIIDYEVGNVLSVQRALKSFGYESIISRDVKVIETAEILILPGVGAFEKAMKKLDEFCLVSLIRNHVNENKLLVGICLGMQLLFESSSEFGQHRGLGFVKGNVERIPESEDYKVPHIGWNKLKWKHDIESADQRNENEWFYFVHSYGVSANLDCIIATTTYGDNEIGAIVKSKNVIGFQFHPEKSGEAGIGLLAYYLQNR